MISSRRQFLARTGSAFSAATLSSSFITSCGDGGNLILEAGSNDSFRISLAQWSQHIALKAGTLDNLDWPAYVKTNFQIEALEWVNQFFSDKNPTLGNQPKGQAYLADMKKRCDDNGIRSLLIMCDGVGRLGDPDDTKRNNAVEGHYAWLEAAKHLGCHSIRVNAASDAELSPENQGDLCVQGLGQLSEKASEYGLNVIVENHGGLSSHGGWLANVLKTVGRDNCGALPDFGNFFVVKNRGNADKYAVEKANFEGDPELVESEKGLEYDRYKGTRELMPYAKGVSAKAHDFDENGNEVHTDFVKMMTIVKDSGYEGYIGVEYEGKEIGEDEGILKTKALIEESIAALA